MARIAGIPESGRIILDSGGVLALSEGDGDARAALERGRQAGLGVVIPAVVVAEVHRGGRHRAKVDRILNSVDEITPTTDETARRAGELQARAGTNDPVDAIVVAEALAAIPAVIITGDGKDIKLLLQTQSDGRRVAVVEV